MGKKNRRKIKKQKEYKTLEERKREIDTIKKKLENLGLTQEMDPIKEFYLKTQQFIDTGEPWCGKIKIHGCKRILSAVLTSSKNKQCTTALLYSEHV